MAKTKSAPFVLPEGKVNANPTKEFFVRMLTRDIALIDAIMDLVDNCIDGVHRQLGKQKKKRGTEEAFIYKGFTAEINLNQKEFTLQDNCGGDSV